MWENDLVSATYWQTDQGVPLFNMMAAEILWLFIEFQLYNST